MNCFDFQHTYDRYILNVQWWPCCRNLRSTCRDLCVRYTYQSEALIEKKLLEFNALNEVKKWTLHMK